MQMLTDLDPIASVEPRVLLQRSALGLGALGLAGLLGERYRRRGRRRRIPAPMPLALEGAALSRARRSGSSTSS